MQIVSRSSPFSYSPVPPVPLLTAPLIAGLLPARVPSSVEIVVEFRPTREEILRQLGPIRSREEMNAEIADLVLDAASFMAGFRDLREKRSRSAGQSREGDGSERP